MRHQEEEQDMPSRGQAQAEPRHPPQEGEKRRHLGHTPLHRVRVAVDPDHVNDRLRIEIKPCKGHDRQVEVMLVAHNEFLDATEAHRPIVELRKYGAEIAIRHRESWEMLNVRIVLDGVRHHMVRIMRLLPPAHADASQQVPDYEAKDPVKPAHVDDAVVSTIVTDARALLEKETQHYRPHHGPSGGAGGAAASDGGKGSSEQEAEEQHKLPDPERPPDLEQPQVDEVLAESAEVLNSLGGRIIHKLPNQERWQTLLGAAGVEG
mmetsp:Transcript_22989/g.48894  ORF Transcript_22989/g.48894 Transcript_22989/m.48894 type:complete len:264 (-) Transcript_22989:697-1488(-)